MNCPRETAVSMGVVLFNHVANSPLAFMERADRSPCESKKRGENQVVLVSHGSSG